MNDYGRKIDLTVAATQKEQIEKIIFHDRPPPSTSSSSLNQ